MSFLTRCARGACAVAASLHLHPTARPRPRHQKVIQNTGTSIAKGGISQSLLTRSYMR